MARAADAAAATPVGRPRATPRTSALAPREEILEAAARLFVADGFTETTTRRIAEAVGLRQASIFHYFPRKDDILAELLDRSVQPALDFAKSLASEVPDPAVALYLLIVHDVRNFARGPGDLGALQLQPIARGAPFAAFWRKRARLRAAYQRFVEAGIASGSLAAEDPGLATTIIFGMVEGVATWYSPKRHRDAERVWHEVAGQALRTVLHDPGQLPAVRAQARQAEARPQR